MILYTCPKRQALLALFAILALSAHILPVLGRFFPPLSGYASVDLSACKGHRVALACTVNSTTFIGYMAGVRASE